MTIWLKSGQFFSLFVTIDMFFVCLFFSDIDGKTCQSCSGEWISLSFYMLKCFGFSRAFWESNRAEQWCCVIWLRMNISAVIIFPQMTPTNSLLRCFHAGNSLVCNQILYAIRWLYKKILLGGYCAIRFEMKLAERWL